MDRLSGRLVIVMTSNIFVHPAGNSVYLSGFAAAAREAGLEPWLICPTPYRPHGPWIRIETRFLAPFVGVRFRRTLRLGSLLVSVDPRDWLGWFRNKRLRSNSTRFFIQAPSPGQATWTLRAIRRLRPRFVVSNYFAASTLFERLRGVAPTGILAHDIFSEDLDRKDDAQVGEAVTAKMEDFARWLDDEYAAYARADVAIMIKQGDVERIRPHAPATPATVFPVSVPPAAPAEAGPEAPVALYIGDAHAANVDGLDWLLREIWPRVRAARPDARLRVAGRAGEVWDGEAPEGAEILGLVPSLDAEWAGATLSTAPIRFGSGVKVKIVESLAKGVPCVSTTLAADGIAPAPETALRLGDGAEGFAAAMLAG
ncbi:MAG: glycosyltransferase family 4 protein, partial [Pseudomonadota bacterium]